MNRQLKKTVRPLFHGLRRLAPATYYRIRYFQAIRKLGDSAAERGRRFSSFLDDNAGKRCLQIGVKEADGAKFGPNWVSVDLYDTREFIDYHYDLHDLKFEDGSFDAVACISVLEHVPRPEKAISELWRVLKPGGEIWVQLPFNYPYHASPKDYWRVSPDGLRVWMSAFEEVRCGSFLFTKTSLVTSSFFHGRKPLASESAKSAPAQAAPAQVEAGSARAGSQRPAHDGPLPAGTGT